MSPLAIGVIVFACVFGAAMLGLFIGDALPEHHLSQDSKDVVKLGTALIATMAALVLSLLISSAKSSFDKMDSELVENAARAISLDRVLADYGPETRELRDLLKRSYAARIELLFPGDKSKAEERTPLRQSSDGEHSGQALGALATERRPARACGRRPWRSPARCRRRAGYCSCKRTNRSP